MNLKTNKVKKALNLNNSERLIFVCSLVSWKFDYILKLLIIIINKIKNFLSCSIYCCLQVQPGG